MAHNFQLFRETYGTQWPSLRAPHHPVDGEVSNELKKRPLTRPLGDLSHKGRGIHAYSSSFFGCQIKKYVFDEGSPLPLWERSPYCAAIGRVRGINKLDLSALRAERSNPVLYCIWIVSPPAEARNDESGGEWR